MMLTRNCLIVGMTDCISILRTRQKSGNLLSSSSTNLSFFAFWCEKMSEVHFVCFLFKTEIFRRTWIFWWKQYLSGPWWCSLLGWSLFIVYMVHVNRYKYIMSFILLIPNISNSILVLWDIYLILLILHLFLHTSA